LACSRFGRLACGNEYREHRRAATNIRAVERYLVICFSER
jgi:hypothetical protein